MVWVLDRLFRMRFQGWYRIDSSRMPGMTTGHTRKREPTTAYGAVRRERIDCVLRTARIKTAGTAEPRADETLISAQRADHELGRDFLHACDTRSQCLLSDTRSCALSRAWAGGLAVT